jgi:BirA family biotin operon repressor/biotin-[acetyl-CoA-carboxylase] ligase
MSVKDTVLRILEENKGETVSGQKIATEAGASRAAVWKAITLLREEGHIISATTNKGYSLSETSDLLSSEGIHAFCREIQIDQIHCHKVVDSTNTMAKKLATSGDVDLALIVSEEQTSGRGRMGRSFYSPQSTGVYMSLLIKPTFDISKSVLVTTAASVAVCRAIEEILGVHCQIKWVNDIFLGDKKVGGILTEGITDFESGQVEYIVIGIGINYIAPVNDFPEELQHVAGALIPFSSALSHGQTKSRNLIIGAIASQLLQLLERLDPNEFLPEYRERSFIIGHPVTFYFHKSGQTEARQGVAMDIDGEGGLVVQQDDGDVITLNSGEVTLRRIYP